MVARPILFSGEMVRAIFGGRKTQTRRVVGRVVSGTVQGEPVDCIRDVDGEPSRLDMAPDDWEICPYGVPGDSLWVRETWRPEELPGGLYGIRYRADDGFVPIEETKVAAERWGTLLRPEERYPELREPTWRPSIHMHRWASRLTLRVTETRVQRVQDITEDDAIAEGIPAASPYVGVNYEDGSGIESNTIDWAPSDWFRELWDSLNAKRGYRWEGNPWVWCVTFEAVQ